MHMNVIGTCSLCGGPVAVPTMSTRAVASCGDCGARARHPHGPTVEMDPATRRFERQKDCPSHDTRCTADTCVLGPEHPLYAQARARFI